jgi:hypothetical protein
MYFPFFIIDFYNSWKRQDFKRTCLDTDLILYLPARCMTHFCRFLDKNRRHCQSPTLGHNEKREVEWPRGHGTTLTTVLKELT